MKPENGVIQGIKKTKPNSCKKIRGREKEEKKNA